MRWQTKTLILAGATLFLGATTFGLGSVFLGAFKKTAPATNVAVQSAPASGATTAPAGEKPAAAIRAAPNLAEATPAAKDTAEAYASTPDIVWGVNGHPFTAYPDIPMSAQFDAMQKLGATHYRINLRADGSIPLLDSLIDAAAKRGITIVPIIPADVTNENETAKLIYYKSYKLARALAERYARRIKVWELGNELENYAIIQPCELRDDGSKYPCEWGPAGGVEAAEYFGPRWEKVSAALRGMSDGVHDGDPDALRAAGTAGWGHFGAFDRMLHDGINWEISVWHQYEADQEWALKRISALGKPIWITEFNFPNGSKNGETEQAAGLTTMMARHREIRSRYHIDAVFIYELFDEPYWEGSEGMMGLVRLQRGEGNGWAVAGPKPAYEAVRTLIAAGPKGASAKDASNLNIPLPSSRPSGR